MRVESRHIDTPPKRTKVDISTRFVDKSPSHLGHSSHSMNTSACCACFVSDVWLGAPVTRRFGTVEDAATLMGVSTKTIMRRVKDGTIPVYRLGARTIRIDLDELASEVRTVGGDAA